MLPKNKERRIWPRVSLTTDWIISPQTLENWTQVVLRPYTPIKKLGGGERRQLAGGSLGPWVGLALKLIFKG